LLSVGRKPRLLVLTSTFPRGPDDTAPRFVLDLCKQLSRFAELRVLAPAASGAPGSDTLEGVPVTRYLYFLPAYQSLAYDGGILGRLRENPLRGLQLPFFAAALLRATHKAIGEWKPDVVHAHWIIPQGLAACLASRGRVPVLCTGHGTDLHGLQAAPFRALKAWALKRCRIVTVVSEELADRVRELAPGSQTLVIPMGTDLQTLFTPPQDPDLRRDNEILFVGRLVNGKGLTVLIEAFATLRKSMPQTKLTIVGDGPLRAEIETRIGRLNQEAHVDLVGASPHRGLAEFYRRATLAVSPSLREGFGLVVTEAMGCGCPVIASDLPAFRARIESGVTGMLVPPDDAGALARALLQLLGDAALRRDLSSAALGRAREEFDWPVVAERYWTAIQECLGESDVRS